MISVLLTISLLAAFLLTGCGDNSANINVNDVADAVKAIQSADRKSVV